MGRKGKWPLPFRSRSTPGREWIRTSLGPETGCRELASSTYSNRGKATSGWACISVWLSFPQTGRSVSANPAHPIRHAPRFIRRRKQHSLQAFAGCFPNALPMRIDGELRGLDHGIDAGLIVNGVAWKPGFEIPEIVLGIVGYLAVGYAAGA